MKTIDTCAPRFQFTVQQLVDAIPLRLSEMIEFSAPVGMAGRNDGRFHQPSRRELRGRYMSEPALLSLFRVHN